LSNIWGTTLDIVDRTGSLNKAQSVPNADGGYTYVISPSIRGGQLDRLRRPAGGHPDLRMAEFGEAGPQPSLGARGRVVKLDRLDVEVPGCGR
jgi:hypothetical protein